MRKIYLDSLKREYVRNSCYSAIGMFYNNVKLCWEKSICIQEFAEILNLNLKTLKKIFFVTPESEEEVYGHMSYHFDGHSSTYILYLSLQCYGDASEKSAIGENKIQFYFPYATDWLDLYDRSL